MSQMSHSPARHPGENLSSMSTPLLHICNTMCLVSYLTEMIEKIVRLKYSSLSINNEGKIEFNNY